MWLPNNFLYWVKHPWIQRKAFAPSLKLSGVNNASALQHHFFAAWCSASWQLPSSCRCGSATQQRRPWCFPLLKLFWANCWVITGRKFQLMRKPVIWKMVKAKLNARHSQTIHLMNLQMNPALPLTVHMRQTSMCVSLCFMICFRFEDSWDCCCKAVFLNLFSIKPPLSNCLLYQAPWL